MNVADGADVTGSNAPQAHAASHQDTETDEISVVALSGLLADDQHVLDAEVQAVSINNVVEDTTPQLGGELDALNNKIVNLADADHPTDAANLRTVLHHAGVTRFFYLGSNI